MALWLGYVTIRMKGLCDIYGRVMLNVVVVVIVVVV
jgi:hypothetical protein